MLNREEYTLEIKLFFKPKSNAKSKGKCQFERENTIPAVYKGHHGKNQIFFKQKLFYTVYTVLPDHRGSTFVIAHMHTMLKEISESLESAWVNKNWHLLF